MFNYDKPSRIFPCILLTRNHMISSAIWNKQALVNLFQIALEIMRLPIQIETLFSEVQVLVLFLFFF